MKNIAVRPRIPPHRSQEKASLRAGLRRRDLPVRQATSLMSWSPYGKPTEINLHA
jgi:hypothetical protein